MQRRVRREFSLCAPPLENSGRHAVNQVFQAAGPGPQTTAITGGPVIPMAVSLYRCG